MSRPVDNAFLRSLSASTLAGFAGHLTPIELSLGQVLQRPEDRVEWVYCSITALLSVLTHDAAGDSVETAMSGNEGAVGVLEALGSGVSTTTNLVQVDGLALRLPVRAVRKAAFEDPGFLRAAVGLIELQMFESRQSGMCNALHSVEPRFARWLVETMDRTGGRTDLPLTQQFIAAMLGVQRTTVTAYATQLQKHGLISYKRGRLQLVDPEGLEHRACECRAHTVENRRRLGLPAIPIGGEAWPA